MAEHFSINPFRVSYLVYVITLMVISASYVAGIHNRRSYHNREFNRFEPKKLRSYHRYEGHIKQTHKNGQPSFAINTMHDVQGYDKMDGSKSVHPPLLKGKLLKI
jgi:hypothetical protein